MPTRFYNSYYVTTDRANSYAVDTPRIVGMCVEQGGVYTAKDSKGNTAIGSSCPEATSKLKSGAVAQTVKDVEKYAGIVKKPAAECKGQPWCIDQPRSGSQKMTSLGGGGSTKTDKPAPLHGKCNNKSGINPATQCCNCDDWWALGCHMGKVGCEMQGGFWNAIRNGGLIVPILAGGFLLMFMMMARRRR